MLTQPRPVDQFPGDRVSATYNIARAILSFGMDGRWKRRSLRSAGLAQRVHIDLGTGSGAMLAHDKKSGTISVGLDYELAMLVRARRTLTNTCWVAGNVDALPFRTAAADLVTASFLLRYIPDPGELVREARDLLQPGGTLLVYDLVRPNSVLLRSALIAYLIVGTSIIGLLLHGDVCRYRHLWQTVSRFEADDLTRALRSHGFTNISLTAAAGGAVVWVIGQKP